MSKKYPYDDKASWPVSNPPKPPKPIMPIDDETT
jgi:hypothetical protein